MLLLRLHTICCVCLWRVRLAPVRAEVCLHACTRFIGSPAMIKMPPRFLATSISPLVSGLDRGCSSVLTGHSHCG